MSRNLTAPGVFTNNAEGPAVDQFGVLHATGYGVRVKSLFHLFLIVSSFSVQTVFNFSFERH